MKNSMRNKSFLHALLIGCALNFCASLDFILLSSCSDNAMQGGSAAGRTVEPLSLIRNREIRIHCLF